MRTLFAFLLIGVILSSTAVAQDRGWFVTAQLGASSYDTLQTAPTGFFGDTDGSSFAWALGAGYDFNRFFAIRGMFERSSNHDTINLCPPGGACPAVVIRNDTAFNNWSLVAMPRLPIGQRAGLYGTFGVQNWDANGESPLPDGDGTEFLFGGGVDYELTERVSIGGEVQASAANYLGGRFLLRYSF